MIEWFFWKNEIPEHKNFLKQTIIIHGIFKNQRKINVDLDPLSRRTPETHSEGPRSPYASFAYNLDEDDADHMAYLESRVSR